MLTKEYVEYIKKAWSRSVEEHLNSQTYSSYQRKKINQLSSTIIDSIIANFNDKDKPEIGILSIILR